MKMLKAACQCIYSELDSEHIIIWEHCSSPDCAPTIDRVRDEWKAYWKAYSKPAGIDTVQRILSNLNRSVKLASRFEQVKRLLGVD